MKFIETNKNLPEGSKDLILNIYGIKSKSGYYYNRDKKKIVKQEEKSGQGKSAGSGEKGSSGNLYGEFGGALSKEIIEEDLHELISFSSKNLGNVDVNEVKKGNQQKEAGEFTLNYMKKVAEAQGTIDAACKAGIISKSERKHYMDSYIAPVCDYLESNLK